MRELSAHGGHEPVPRYRWRILSAILTRNALSRVYQSGRFARIASAGDVLAAWRIAKAA